MRQPATQSGGTSCPQFTRFDVSTPGIINRQWSTSLGTSPVTILTGNQTPAGELNEIEAVIQQSLAGVDRRFRQFTHSHIPGDADSYGLGCGMLSSSDGLNSICFNQNDAGFAIGVLAFTRVVSADTVGEQLSPGTLPSTFVGQILDADVLLRPGDSNTTFATPAALPVNPNAYDLESIVTHELGHSFGFDHSGVWRAMMFPFAPPPGQFTGTRPTTQSPDAALSDDDRTGLRVLYPNAGDTVHVGTISGHILPANPIVLPISPAGVTGIFPAQVVAVDNATWKHRCRNHRRMELRESRPSAVRWLVFDCGLARWCFAKLSDLCRAARRPGHVGECDLQLNGDLQELAERPRLAGAVCLHGPGVGSAFFGACATGVIESA